MGLKRYTRDELITILDDMLWEEIATSNKRWECDNVVITEGKSIPRQGMEQRLNNLKVFRERKKITTRNVKKKVSALITKLSLQEHNTLLENLFAWRKW